MDNNPSSNIEENSEMSNEVVHFAPSSSESQSDGTLASSSDLSLAAVANGDGTPWWNDANAVFELFNAFPPEIRVMIWKEAILQNPQVFKILQKDGNNPTEPKPSYKVPATLGVDQESREEALRFYSLLPFPTDMRRSYDPQKIPYSYVGPNDIASFELASQLRGRGRTDHAMQIMWAAAICKDIKPEAIARVRTLEIRGMRIRLSPPVERDSDITRVFNGVTYGFPTSLLELFPRLEVVIFMSSPDQAVEWEKSDEVLQRVRDVMKQKYEELFAGRKVPEVEFREWAPLPGN